MTETERKELNKLTMQLIEESGRKLVNIPGIQAILVTIVGDAGTPIGAVVYHNEHQSGYTLLQGIARLSEHIRTLARALGEADERRNRGSVERPRVDRDESNGSTTATDTTPDATGATAS